MSPPRATNKTHLFPLQKKSRLWNEKFIPSFLFSSALAAKWRTNPAVLPRTLKRIEVKILLATLRPGFYFLNLSGAFLTSSLIWLKKKTKTFYEMFTKYTAPLPIS